MLIDQYPADAREGVIIRRLTGAGLQFIEALVSWRSSRELRL